MRNRPLPVTGRVGFAGGTRPPGGSSALGRRRSWLDFAALLALTLGSLAPLRADVALPRVIGDHMVLQRDTTVPIWGRAAPDEKVTVRFDSQAKTTTADSEG